MLRTTSPCPEIFIGKETHSLVKKKKKKMS
jgi:hypothetical protein